MKSPLTNKEMTLKVELSEMDFRNETFKYFHNSYYCEDTGNEFTTTELDELNLSQVYNQYRDKHNIPFPNEFSDLKNKYKLSASKMSQILGLGINSYRNYERGEVPSLAIGNLIQSIITNPQVFKQLVQRADSLNSKEKKETVSRIDKLEALEENRSEEDKYLFSLFRTELPTLASGYTKPNVDKLREVIVFFSERLKPTVTAMNKLLFYADFLNFKKTCFSITGTTYMAHQYGPVPKRFRTIFDHFENQKVIKLNETEFGIGGPIGETFEPMKNIKFNEELFSQVELTTLETVVKNFEGKNATYLKDKSHEEEAWIKNEETKSDIDYFWSFKIKNIK